MRSMFEVVAPWVCRLQSTDAALGMLAIAAATIPSAASSRDYSIHMLAHVPKVCSFGATRPYISLADDAKSTSHTGNSSIRISCNVNYALSFSRVGGRGAVSSVALDEQGRALSLVVVTREANGDALEATCPAIALSRLGSICDAVAGPGDMRIAKPRGVAHLQVTRSQVTNSGAPVRSDVADEMPSVATVAAHDTKGSDATDVDHLRMTISARL